MALPKQVQQQLDEVEELEKQLEAQGEETKAKPEVKKKKTSKKAKAKDRGRLKQMVNTATFNDKSSACHSKT